MTTVVFMVFGVGLWIKFVIAKAFAYMDRVNQFLLDLVAGVLTETRLSFLYFMVLIR